MKTNHDIIVNGDCLQNLSIVKNQNDNANSLTLGWEYKCGQCSQCDTEEVNMIKFKIYWEHQEWMACDIKKNVSKFAARQNCHKSLRLVLYYIAYSRD